MQATCSSSPFEQIICLSHRFEAIGNKYVFQPMGLSSISMHILQLLKNNGPQTSSDLIKMTNSTKSNMSQRLSFLEKESYVTKTYASNDDKRKIIIKLTPSGGKRLTDLEKRLKKAQISFEKKFSTNELAQHKAFFKKMNTILDNSENELEKIFKF